VTRAAGKDLGVKLAGMQALNTLRIEKGYRDYGHDIDGTDTPLEAGLSFLVDFNKPNGFIGKEALLKQKEAGALKKRFVQLLLDDPEPLLYYGEMIYRNGKIVGYVRSGAYGFTVGGAVALALVLAWRTTVGVTRSASAAFTWRATGMPSSAIMR